MAQASLEDLRDLEGENTFEGDVENDTNPQGGIDKAEVMDRRRGPPKEARKAFSQSAQLQGRKTHEQQLRILERNPDAPDLRHPDQETSFAKTVSGKPEAGAPIKPKGDGSGAMTDLHDDMLAKMRCCRTATRPRVRVSAARTANGSRPNSARTTAQTAAEDKPRHPRRNKTDLVHHLVRA
jgi:hypothetical protein